MEEQNQPQKTAVAPQKTAVAPQKTAVAPQKTAVAPQKTAVAPQKTAVVPQKTAVAPQKTAVAPQKTAVAPQKTAVAPGNSAVPNSAIGGAPHKDSVTVGGKTYKVEKSIGSGTEGDIYIVSDDKGRYALKSCHPGFQTNVAVMPSLQKLNGKGYISDIVDFADDFELLEFITGGSAASANIRGNADAILTIAVKTAMGLSEMHKLGIIHKDIKPANILIKDPESWDCVLCDFGIADVLNESGKVVTLQARTPIYAAPEMYAANTTRNIDGEVFCELTPAADYYALGMTILSLWMGEGAFKAKEKEMAFDKANGRIIVPADMPNPLAKICRGLLISDAANRWNYDKIERTMKGEDVPLVEAEVVALDIKFNESKNIVATTPIELGDCMADDPVLGKKYLYNGKVEKWLKPFPELAVEMQEIVEKRFPLDQEMGYYAALCVLNPALPFPLSGTLRETGETTSAEAITLKDVGNFCNDAIVSEETAEALSSDKFKEWVRVRNAAIVESFPQSVEDYTVLDGDIYRLRVQLIDPLSDINLRNDTSHPDYAMTGEAIGRFLNKVYNIFYNVCENDIEKVEAIWNNSKHAPENRQIPADLVIQIAANFADTVEYNYIPQFFNTKGRRFKEQTRWFFQATERAGDFSEKAGPKDDSYFEQMSWMKVIKGFGATPEYELVDTGKTVTTVKEVLRENKKTLQNEYYHRGLDGFLAVCLHENPNADLKPQFAYEKLLHEYVETLAKIDDEMDSVVRFREATKEASSLLSEGQGKIRTLVTRNIAQYVLTIVFAVVPALFLLLMLLLSIVDNPIIDTNAFKLERYIWVVGLIIAIALYSKNTEEEGGCLGSLIAGVVLAVVLYFLVKFLGQYILYIFAVLVIAALVYFSMKTLFTRSQYAADAKKFSKPGFDEKVLEPLYYAFDEDQEEFDSSFNGAFNDDDMLNWKDELRVRRIFILIFIGVIWLLLLFSLLVPKSGRFQRLTAPLTEKVAPIFNKMGSAFDKLFPAPEETEQAPTMGFEELQPGAQGDEVRILQEFLKDHGYTKNKADGDYGRGTKKSVSAFQKDVGLKATGIADKETVEAMNKKLKEDFDAAKEAEKEAKNENQKEE